MYELDPAFDYDLTLPDQLVFQGPGGGITIHDKFGLIKATLDCLSQGRPVDEVYGVLESDADRCAAKEHILQTLAARGIIRPLTTCSYADKDKLQAWLRFAGLNKQVDPIIGIIGQGAIADTVAAELSALGLQYHVIGDDAPDCDLGILCQDVPNEGVLRSVNRQFVDLGVPLLPVAVRRHVISTGPLIIAGATACAECVYHRAKMNAAPDAAPPVSASLANSAFTLRLAAMFVVEEALRFVYGVAYDLHIATLTRYSVLTGQRKSSVVLKVPRCPVCASRKLRTQPLADTFDRAVLNVAEFAE